MFSRRKSTQRSNTAASPVKPPPPTLPALETSSDGDGSPFVVPLPTSSAISLTREGNPPQRRSSTASLSPSYRAPIVTQVAPSSYHRPSSSSRQGPDSPPRGSAYISASHPAGFTDPQPRSSQREGGGRFSIASLYPSPTAGLSTPSSASVRPSASLPNVRRSQKIPPSLNIMVVGARNTGKTSWIRAFLGNADLAGTAGRGQRKEAEERIATFGVARGGRGTMVERTRSLESMTVEVMNRGEKMSLTVVDMAGWETSLGGSSSVAEELEVERQLNGVIRNIEGRFDETLKAEAQLIRQSHRAHDSHFHLALYFIHPDSITSHPPAPKRTNKISLGRSMSTPHLARKGKGGGGEPVWDASEKIGHLEPDGEPAPTETVDRQEEELGLSEVDLRAIKRLSKRVNVLVVIARSDTLTISRLQDLKDAIKRDLDRAGLGFGVFAPSSTSSTALLTETAGEAESDGEVSASRGRSAINNSSPRKHQAHSPPPPLPTSNGLGAALSTSPAGATDSVPGLSPSTSATLDLPGPCSSSDEGPTTPEQHLNPLGPAPTSVKLIRIRSTSRTRLGRKKSLKHLHDNGQGSDGEVGGEEMEEPESPNFEELLPFAVVSPERIGGGTGRTEWVREFRFGRLDVLNPEHCDFLPLKQAILSNANLLRDTTRLDKYESYRTQRLLQRRATRQLPKATRDSILHEVAAL